ncbi:unnamed protein product, partial [marine sediment metagenome]
RREEYEKEHDPHFEQFLGDYILLQHFRKTFGSTD